MRVLLDTNVFLWLHAAPERVGGLLPMLEDPSTERLVSAVVGWEIAIKHGLGRLQLPEPPERWVPSRIQRGAMVVVPNELSHVLGVRAEERRVGTEWVRPFRFRCSPET